MAFGNLPTFCVFVSFLTIYQGQQVTAVDQPLVQLSTGVVRGWSMPTGATPATNMLVFKGIPYAKAPSGTLRFLAPVAPDSWTVEKNLTQSDPPVCPQIITSSEGTATASTNEDCLFINVYTPEAKAGDLLPVIVWIHGGALSGGSSEYANYAPDYLVRQGVIFVSFNYRLGVLGFLNLGTSAVPGNAGLKDQNMALRWVQREISNFGGDPTKVTLFGQSAGATSVTFHYISPNSQGLFSKAICDSGSAFSETSFLQEGFLERAKSFSDSLNCTFANGTIDLVCLQTATVAKVLSNQQLNLSDEFIIPGNTIMFPATLEINSTTAVLPDTPQNLVTNLINSNRARIPLIMGVNHDEGTLQVTSNADYYAQLPNKLQYFIRTPIRSRKSDAEIKNNVNAINTYYFRNTTPSVTNIDGYIKLYGDKMFSLYVANFARRVAVFGNVYLYHFDYSGSLRKPFPPAVAANINLSTKVGHGEELGYIFYNSAQNALAEDTPEKITLHKMVRMWTDFAKYGNPTPSGQNNTIIGSFKWTPVVNETVLPYLIITNTTQMSSINFLEEEVAFWNQIEHVNFGSMTSCSVILLIASLMFKLFL